MRRGLAAALPLALAAAALAPALALAVILPGASGDSSAATCGAQPNPGSATSLPSGLSAAQLGNAAVILAVARSLPGMGDPAAAVALDAAMTEDSLLNTAYGDGSSLGLFQIQDSWGSAQDRLDPVWESRWFFSQLAAIAGWEALPIDQAAQAVERSAFPGRYAANVALAEALVGASPGASIDNCPAGTGGYVNPYSAGQWSPARIDQGLDYLPLQPEPILVIGDAVVVSSSEASGWPGGAFVAYRLLGGDHAGLVVYVAEHLSGLPAVGARLSAGQPLALALPGYPWTESGFASPDGAGPCASCLYAGRPDGTATEGGRAFTRWMRSLGVPALDDPGPGSAFP